MEWFLIAPIAGLASIGVAGYFYFYVSKKDSGNPRMREIAEAIKEGSTAYLKRQYQNLTVFVIILAVVLGAFLGVSMAAAYVVGAICSGVAGFLGLGASVLANVRTARAAEKGLSNAFPIAFFGGAVTGFSVVGLALLGMSILYYVYQDPNILLGFSFGASSIALFAKAGGGIFTKTADIGADLVGKVELGIPEDDPRNPAVIADNVGDNVGDCAGMGADLFDSYVASIVAAMILGTALFGFTYTILPLLFAAVGIFASIIGLLLARAVKTENPGSVLNLGTYTTCLIFAVLAFVIVHFLGVDINIFYATVAGLIAGVVIGVTSDYFTSIDRSPVLKTAEAAQTGPAIVILEGFSYGLLSTVTPIIGICVAIIAAWYFGEMMEVGGGVYGVAISAVGMLSIVGMVISNDAFGPISDNAKGIAEMSGLGENVVDVADKLDAAGNTVKAITKGFAIGAAALTVLSLFVAYAEVVGIESIDLMNPYVLVGAFMGAVMPPLLSALLILGVGKNAFVMVEEVRRQFREIPGLIKGEAKPDYAACVDIAAKGALKELILPSILCIVVPLAVGLILGKYALGGFLAGSIFTGLIFALLMANSGGAWDNAKKYIEAGHFGGKGSNAHKAAVIGDTVGDPFKDTAGPSLNTMITVMSLTASVFAPLIVQYALSG